MSAITPDLLVDDVMRRWPATLRVFPGRPLSLRGLPIACFHTVADACREHGSPLQPVLDALRRAATQESTSVDAPG